jgi:hypothetical protein
MFVGAHDAVQCVDDFLHVVKMEIFNVPLVSGLRGTAHGRPAGLDALDLLLLFDRAQGEYQDARPIRIEQHGGVARVLVREPHQRINVRHGTNEQPMLRQRRLELNGFEELTGAGRCEDRQTVRRAVQFAVEIGVDAFDVPLEAGAFGRIRGQAPQALGEHFLAERRVAIATVLVWRKIQVEADNRETVRLERREPLQLIAERDVEGGAFLRHAAWWCKSHTSIGWIDVQEDRAVWLATRATFILFPV